MEYAFVKKLTADRNHEMLAIVRSITVQNILLSHLLFKTIMIKIKKLFLCLLFFMCDTVRHIQRRTQARECENKMLRKIIGSKKEEVTKTRKVVL
jgi:hypothetical protein